MILWLLPDLCGKLLGSIVRGEDDSMVVTSHFLHHASIRVRNDWLVKPVQQKGPAMKAFNSLITIEIVSRLRRLSLLLLTLCCAVNLMADVVYVTSRPQPRGKGPNDDGTYDDAGLGDDTSAFSTAPGTPTRDGSRYFSNSFSNSTPDYGITITPTLGLAGGIYQVDHTYSSTAENLSSNIVLRVTNVARCTLSFS